MVRPRYSYNIAIPRSFKMACKLLKKLLDINIATRITVLVPLKMVYAFIPYPTTTLYHTWADGGPVFHI
jgi:hypothetical protein